MRAQIVRELGGIAALKLEEIDSPPLSDGQVRIGVEAAALNFPDLLIIQGLYQFRPDLPFSPGAEGAGTVLEVGPRVDGLNIGDRVVGVSTHGALAEEFVVPAYNVFAVPDGLSFQQAAAIPMAYGTAYHALVDRARIESGETLLVTGATGGVGSAAIQLGKVLRATVIAVVGSEAKIEVAKSLGADHTIVHSPGTLKDRVRELTDDSGVDVVCDQVGGDLFLDTLRCVAWEGRVLVVGFTSGTIPKAPANLMLLKGSSVVGVFWGDFARREPERNRANLDRIMQMATTGEISPHISLELPFEETARGLEYLASRQVTGKVVLTM